MGGVLRQLGSVLSRVLGIELLARLSHRLPGRGPWVASLVLLVVVNLLPVWAVLRGSATIGDVFFVYWAENVVVWAVTIVRVATARAPEKQGAGPPSVLAGVGSALFFAFHFGMFTAVHGVFTLLLVHWTGLTAGRGALTVLIASIALGHLVVLGLVWFGRGERLVTSPGRAMGAPYPRMFALHVAIIGGFFVLLGGAATDGPLAGVLGVSGGVAILCLVKTAIDVSFHLKAWRRVPDQRPDRPGDLYGGPAAA